MTPVLQPQLEKVTLEQYEMLPEEKRFEVFDGVVYDMASPSQVHQALSMQLSTLINTYILRKKSYIFLTHFHDNSNELKKSPNLITIKTMKITQIKT
jgi:Uma2 family endonuclease